MELSSLTRQARENLAASGTEREVLVELAKDPSLLSILLKNPYLPDDVRDGVYDEFPHLRPGYVDEKEAAIAAYRGRRGPSGPGFPTGFRSPDSFDYTSRPQPAPTYSRPYNPGTNGFAVASLVLALVGGSILAVIFGHVAKSQIARDGGSGEGMATAGLVIGYLSLMLFCFFACAAIGSAGSV